MEMSNATARRQLAKRRRYLRRKCQALRECQMQLPSDILHQTARLSWCNAKLYGNIKRSCKAERFHDVIAKPCVNVKRSRKAAICQTWKIPACGAIIKPCANAKRSCKVAICRAAKTLRQPRSQPAVAYVHGFPCPQVCFPVSRALSRWQSVIPTPPCLRPALQSAETPPGPLRAT